MGQYYNVLLKEGKKASVAYDRFLIVKGERQYTMAKLMEHSWIGNHFVDTMCAKIYKTASTVRVVWMGDYGDTIFRYGKNENITLTEQEIVRLYDRCWDENVKTKAIRKADFDFHNKFLINHTQKLYIDLNEYYEKSVMHTKYGDDWCIHPLPLLTCIGNGLGGGDYHAPTANSDKELVGTWAWDEITIDDEPNPNYTKICPIFKERGWEEDSEDIDE